MPVYQDKKTKTWFVSISYTPAKNVHKKIVRRGAKTKREALQREAMLRLELETNTPANIRSLILDDIWKEYAEYNLNVHWKERTYNTKQIIYETHIKNRFGNKNVLYITKKELIDWQQTLVRLKYKVGTINVIQSTFSGIYTYLNDIYDLNYHPLKQIKYISSHKEDSTKKFRIMELDDFTKFISSFDDFFYILLFRTLYSTGIRIGELTGISWDDVKKQGLVIHNNSTDKNGTTKTANSQRIVPIDNGLRKMLQDWLSICKKEDTFNKHSYIFSHPKKPNKPISRYYIIEQLNIHLEECMLPQMTPHDFRHSYVSTLIDAGYDDIAIAELIGDTVETVRSVYAHMLSSRRRNVVDFFNKFASKITFEIKK